MHGVTQVQLPDEFARRLVSVLGDADHLHRIHGQGIQVRQGKLAGRTVGLKKNHQRLLARLVAGDGRQALELLHGTRIEVAATLVQLAAKAAWWKSVPSGRSKDRRRKLGWKRNRRMSWTSSPSTCKLRRGGRERPEQLPRPPGALLSGPDRLPASRPYGQLGGARGKPVTGWTRPSGLRRAAAKCRLQPPRCCFERSPQRSNN